MADNTSFGNVTVPQVQITYAGEQNNSVPTGNLIGGGSNIFNNIANSPEVQAATTPLTVPPSNVSENNVIGNIGVTTNPNQTISSSPPPPAKPSPNVNASHKQSIKKAQANQKPDSLIDLEKKSGLNTEDLVYLKGKFCRINDNYWYLLLCFLVYGFDYQVMTANANPDHAQAHVDQNFIRDFKALANTNDPILLKIIQKTPAFSKHCFDDIGMFGVTHGVNSNKQPANPMSGPTKQAGTSLVERLLNTINNKINGLLENNLNKTRTQAYLALPATAFASFQKAVAAINGIINAYEALLRDIYQGIVQLVQQIYAVINGIIAAIQYYLLSLINKYIIPIDLLCLILELLESFFGDSKFFSSLFNQSAFLNKYLGQFESAINKEVSMVGNVLGSLQPHFPPQVNQVIQIVNSLALNPALGTGVLHYGYHQSLLGLQASLISQIVTKYGPNFAALSPLGQNQNGNTSPFPPAPSTFNNSSYKNYNGIPTYINNMPQIPQTISLPGVSNVPNPFSVFNNPNAGFGNIGNDLAAIGQGFNDIGTAGNNLGTAINNAVNPNTAAPAQ